MDATCSVLRLAPRTEVGAQTRLLANWKFWGGFLEEVAAVYGLNDDEDSTRPLSYSAGESIH